MLALLLAKIHVQASFSQFVCRILHELHHLTTRWRKQIQFQFLVLWYPIEPSVTSAPHTKHNCFDGRETIFFDGRCFWVKIPKKTIARYRNCDSFEK